MGGILAAIDVAVKVQLARRIEFLGTHRETVTYGPESGRERLPPANRQVRD